MNARTSSSSQILSPGISPEPILQNTQSDIVASPMDYFAISVRLILSTVAAFGTLDALSAAGRRDQHDHRDDREHDHDDEEHVPGDEIDELGHIIKNVKVEGSMMKKLSIWLGKLVNED